MKNRTRNHLFISTLGDYYKILRYERPASYLGSNTDRIQTKKLVQMEFALKVTKVASIIPPS